MISNTKYKEAFKEQQKNLKRHSIDKIMEERDVEPMQKSINKKLLAGEHNNKLYHQTVKNQVSLKYIYLRMGYLH